MFLKKMLRPKEIKLYLLFTLEEGSSLQKSN